MQIVSNGDNLHEMSKPVFREKKKKKKNVNNLSFPELAQRDVLHEMSTLFFFQGKIRKHIINLSSAEFSNRVVKSKLV